MAKKSKKKSAGKQILNQTKSSKKTGNDLDQFFGYDIHLIYKDLLRTLVVTSIVVAVLLLILVYIK